MKFRSLRFLMTLSVLLINLISALLTMLLILLLRQFQPFAFLMLPQAALISCIVIGTALSAVVYQRFLRPIDEVIRLTEKIKNGDFTARANPKAAIGNVSKLVHSFNSMAEGLGSVEMLKSDFIGNFSHEFKTPIASIRGFAKQLKRADLNDEERQEYLDIIIKESERLTKMSTNVLLLSRFENEYVLPDLKDFSLDEQIRSCIVLFEKEWTEKDIVWELNLAPTMIHFAPSVLEHIWINLLSNAIKFSPAGSTIEVTCREEDTHAIVSVRDYGIGMDEETASHIFEKFYQADSSRKMRGNGLGLSIVKSIVTLTHGEISVSSAPGQGSTFHVRLPKKPQ